MTRVAQEREYWNDGAGGGKVSAELAVLPEPHDQRLLAFLFAIAPALVPGRILDLGCGVGRLAIPVAQALRDCGRGEVVGVDISREMLARCAAAAPAGLPLRLREGDGRELPAELGTFDSAYCILVFQHLPPEAVHAYIKAIAEKLHEKIGVFRFQFVEGKDIGASTKHGEFSFDHTEDQMVQWCTAAGLEVIEVNAALIHPSWTWITARRR